MSLVDLQNVSDQQYIALYITEQRAKGPCLSYSDYPLITKWLERCDRDNLIFILSELLPEYYAGGREKRLLAGLDKIVLMRIGDLQASHQPIEA